MNETNSFNSVFKPKIVNKPNSHEFVPNPPLRHNNPSNFNQ